MSIEARIVRLAPRSAAVARPESCRWVGDRRVACRTVRVAPDDVAEPIPSPATCPTCGRPTFVRTYIVV